MDCVVTVLVALGVMPLVLAMMAYLAVRSSSCGRSSGRGFGVWRWGLSSWALGFRRACGSSRRATTARSSRTRWGGL